MNAFLKILERLVKERNETEIVCKERLKSGTSSYYQERLLSRERILNQECVLNHLEIVIHFKDHKKYLLHCPEII